MKVACPQCDQLVEVLPEMMGEFVDCPTCSKSIGLAAPNTNGGQAIYGTRRKFLSRILIALPLVGGGFYFYRRKVIQRVNPFGIVSTQEFEEFLQKLSPSEAKAIFASLGLKEAGRIDLEDAMWRVAELSSHKFSNWRRKVTKVLGMEPPKINYHKNVEWTRREFRAPVYHDSTFALERGIFEAFAKRTWDELSDEQKAEFLSATNMEDQALAFAKGKATP